MIPVSIATLIFVASVAISWASMKDGNAGPFPIPDFVRGCFYPVLLLIGYMLFWIVYLAVTR